MNEFKKNKKKEKLPQGYDKMHYRLRMLIIGMMLFTVILTILQLFLKKRGFL